PHRPPLLVLTLTDAAHRSPGPWALTPAQPGTVAHGRRSHRLPPRSFFSASRALLPPQPGPPRTARGSTPSLLPASVSLSAHESAPPHAARRRLPRPPLRLRPA